MEVLERKLELIQWISGLENSKIIIDLIQYKENSASDDIWNELSEFEKNGIEEGLKDIEAGKIVPLPLKAI